MRNRKALYSRVLSLVLAPSLLAPLVLSAQEEDAARGRLPDGRAFRTDSEGNQLVDYLAELELSVETYERQVQALQTELEQKQQLLDRAGITSAKGAAISERTLVGRDSAAAGAGVLTVSAESCAPFVQSCSGDLTSVSKQLEEVQTALAIAKQEQRQRSEVEQREGQRRETESEALQRLRAQVDAREQALAAQEKVLAQRNEALEELSEKLKDREEEITDLAERSRKEEQFAAERLSEMRAKLEKSFELPVQQWGEGQGNERLANAKLRALDSIRGTLSTELNQLRGMITRRDQTYKRINFAGRKVKFGLTPLVSSRGRRINDFSSAIASAKSARDLSMLRSELAELISKVKDDLAVMERMG